MPALAAETSTVDIKLFQFKPNQLEIKKGDTVIWMNGDAIEHSVTAGKPGKPTEAFDFGLLHQGRDIQPHIRRGGEFYLFLQTPSEYAGDGESPALITDS